MDGIQRGRVHNAPRRTEPKIKDKDYLEGDVSINELCIDPTNGTLALSSDPELNPAGVAGIAIFGYTGE